VTPKSWFTLHKQASIVTLFVCEAAKVAVIEAEFHRDHMSQSQAVEGILERLRAAEGMSPSIAGSDELLEFRNQIAQAQEASRQTGQLNPRDPGAVNRAVQFGKKVMRRLLSWYTRPLQSFQAAVIGALQKTGSVLEEHLSQLQSHSEALTLQADAVERDRAWAAEKIQTQAATFEQGLQQLREQLDAIVRSSENAFAGEYRTKLAELEGKLLSLGEFSRQQAERLRMETHPLSTQIRELSRQLRELSTRQEVYGRDLRRLQYTAGPDAVPGLTPATVTPAPIFPSEITGDSEFDYFAFEQQFRGDEASVRERQQVYLDYFRGRDNVVDLGCGRGEFLELLREAGIGARGVESGLDQYLLCKEKGLEGVQQDVFAFLESTPDDSLGGIFSAQVIEHMTAGDQLRLVSLAYRKCKTGSPVVFETINPQCVYALVRNFFLDPTHVRPMHPETLRFAMNSCQFRDVELRFSSPAAGMQVPALRLEGNADVQQFNAGLERLNDLLYGFQDYAAIGWK
jgi:O-antigen chain-terminating methyltransferase